MSKSEDVASRSTFFRRLAFRLRLNWTQKIGRVDFSSGLGDGAWLLYGISTGNRSRDWLSPWEICLLYWHGSEGSRMGSALRYRPKLTNWNASDSVDTYDIMRGHLENLRLMKVVTRDQSAKALVHVPTPIERCLIVDGALHPCRGVR